MTQDIRLSATDVRIGNEVNDLDQVRGLVSVKFKPEHFPQLKYRFSPIPITPEWLERLGFKEEIQAAQWVKGGIAIRHKMFCIMRNNDGVYQSVTECEYVHQLQNLYYHCSGGQELELKGDGNE